MIRINLLKNQARKKGGKQSAGIPKWVPVVVGVLVLLLAAGGGIYFLQGNKKPQPKPVPQVVQKTEFKPSTHVKPNMIEEVVKEVNSERETNKRKGFINLTYDEMSFAEKINYEVFFAYNIFDSLSRIIPSGIGFKALEIDNFLTLYSVGISSNSSLITETFARLKDNLGLLPQPYSSIKENGEAGFRFVITCKPTFGVDLANAYQPIDYLFKRDDIASKIKDFRKLASEFNIVSTSGPVSQRVNKIRDFERYEYRWECTSTYRDFVQFIKELNVKKIPCAFRTLHIKAIRGNKVSVVSDCIFTVKE
jgi:hypothetical protein